MTNKIKNCYLFCGPSGTGKTTIARALSRKINNGKEPGFDDDFEDQYMEWNKFNNNGGHYDA